MRPSSVFVGATAVYFCLICLLSLASSQIAGCDTLNCEQESDNADPQCPLASDGIGTTTFQSNLTADGPLSWTIVGNTDDLTNPGAPKGAERLTKSFHLGTPPSLLLQHADFHGCSLLYYKITSALQTVPRFDDFANFGCDTVLGGQCAQDLLAQARQALTDRLSTDLSPEDGVCTSVQLALQNTKVPNSCNLPFGKTSWGSIGVSAFAGIDNVTYTSQSQGECDITSQGSSYNIAMTNLAAEELDPDSEEAELWRNGTTPLITLLFNRAGDTNPGLVEPEVHLKCLRTVPSAKQASENVGRKLASTPWLAAMAISFIALMW